MKHITKASLLSRDLRLTSNKGNRNGLLALKISALYVVSDHFCRTQHYPKQEAPLQSSALNYLQVETY
jgi:hypothetical protein